MTRPGHHQRTIALQTADVVRISGVPTSTLNHWVASGLCKPSVLGPAGHRVSRYWHPRDLVIVQVIRSLRSIGCSLKNVRKIQHLLEEHWDSDLGTSVLLYDGMDVLIVDDAPARIVSAVKEPGQGIFQLELTVATLPLGKWVTRAVDQATEIDITLERARRRARQRVRAPRQVLAVS